MGLSKRRRAFSFSPLLLGVVREQGAQQTGAVLVCTTGPARAGISAPEEGPECAEQQKRRYGSWEAHRGADNIRFPLPRRKPALLTTFEVEAAHA